MLLYTAFQETRSSVNTSLLQCCDILIFSILQLQKLRHKEREQGRRITSSKTRYSSHVPWLPSSALNRPALSSWPIKKFAEHCSTKIKMHTGLNDQNKNNTKWQPAFPPLGLQNPYGNSSRTNLSPPTHPPCNCRILSQWVLKKATEHANRHSVSCQHMDQVHIFSHFSQGSSYLDHLCNKHRDHIQF